MSSGRSRSPRAVAAGVGVGVGERRARSVRARDIAARLRADILDGRFTTGWLPDEATLVPTYGGSRNATREALQLLAAEGLLDRSRGRGTRVLTSRYAHSLDRLAGLAESLVGQGTVTNRVRDLRALPAPSGPATALGITPGDPVFYLERLRLLDDEPVSLDRSFLAEDIGQELQKRDLRSTDVFVCIEEIVGQPLGAAELRLNAVSLDPATAELLAVPSGSPGFRLDRLARLADGRPVDVEVLHLRGDRIAFTSILHRSANP